MNKISVEDYLLDKDMLETIYIPYEKKVEIVNTILDNFDKSKIDSARLNYIFDYVIITTITNIDLDIESNDGFNGYDLLCYEKEFEELILEIEYEYNKFKEILQYKLNDIYHYESNQIKIVVEQLMNEFNSMLKNVDMNELANKLKDVISQKINQETVQIGDFIRR